MDLYNLARRDLQDLCKRNGIRANMTNVAMADALQALSYVEGIDEIQPQLGILKSGKQAVSTILVDDEKEQQGSPLPGSRRVAMQSSEAMKLVFDMDNEDDGRQQEHLKDAGVTPGITRKTLTMTAMASVTTRTRAAKTVPATPAAASNVCTARRKAAAAGMEELASPVTRRGQRTTTARKAAAASTGEEREGLTVLKTRQSSRRAMPSLSGRRMTRSAAKMMALDQEEEEKTEVNEITNGQLSEEKLEATKDIIEPLYEVREVEVEEESESLKDAIGPLDEVQKVEGEESETIEDVVRSFDEVREADKASNENDEEQEAVLNPENRTMAKEIQGMQETDDEFIQQVDSVNIDEFISEAVHEEAKREQDEDSSHESLACLNDSPVFGLVSGAEKEDSVKEEHPVDYDFDVLKDIPAPIATAEEIAMLNEEEDFDQWSPDKEDASVKDNLNCMKENKTVLLEQAHTVQVTKEAAVEDSDECSDGEVVDNKTLAECKANEETKEAAFEVGDDTSTPAKPQLLTEDTVNSIVTSLSNTSFTDHATIENLMEPAITVAPMSPLQNSGEWKRQLSVSIKEDANQCCAGSDICDKEILVSGVTSMVEVVTGEREEQPQEEQWDNVPVKSAAAMDFELMSLRKLRALYKEQKAMEEKKRLALAELNGNLIQ